MGMLCCSSRAHLHVCFSASQRLCDVHVHSDGAVTVHAQQLQRCPLEAALVPGKAAEDLPSHEILAQSFTENMSAQSGAHAQSAACMVPCKAHSETPLIHNHVQFQPGGMAKQRFVHGWECALPVVLLMPGSMRGQPGARWGSLGNWAQHTGHGQTMRQVDLQGGLLPADMAIQKPGESAPLEPLPACGNMCILQVQGCHNHEYTSYP